MYLSKMLGGELTADRHVAISEDGSVYDFDVGGPACVGGRDGLRLSPLAQADDQAAQLAARGLYAAIRARVPQS